MILWGKIVPQNFKKLNTLSKPKKLKFLDNDEIVESNHPADAYLSQPLKPPSKITSFEQKVEMALRDTEQLDRTKPTQKQENNLLRRSLAEIGQSASKTKKKPPKYPRMQSLKGK